MKGKITIVRTYNGFILVSEQNKRKVVAESMDKAISLLSNCFISLFDGMKENEERTIEFTFENECDDVGRTKSRKYIWIRK